MNEEWIIAVKVIYCSQKLYSLHVRQFDMICSASRNEIFRVLTLGGFCSLENLANCILCILFKNRNTENTGELVLIALPFDLLLQHYH